MFCYTDMEAKVISSASRSNRIVKDRLNKVKKGDHYEVNESVMCRISQMMSHLVSKLIEHTSRIKILPTIIVFSSGC